MSAMIAVMSSRSRASGSFHSRQVRARCAWPRPICHAKFVVPTDSERSVVLLALMRLQGIGGGELISAESFDRPRYRIAKPDR